MFCHKCGNPSPEGAVFCGSCGQALIPPAGSTSGTAHQFTTPSSANNDPNRTPLTSGEQRPVMPPQEQGGERDAVILPFSPTMPAAGYMPTMSGTPQFGQVPTLPGTPPPFTSSPSLPGTPPSGPAPYTPYTPYPPYTPPQFAGAVQQVPQQVWQGEQNVQGAARVASASSKIGTALVVKIVAAVVVLAIITVGAVKAAPLILHTGPNAGTQSTAIVQHNSTAVPRPTAIPAAPAGQQVYRIGVLNFSGDSIDPAIAGTTTTIQETQMIFTGLVALNDQQQIVDQLAQSHSVSSDGLVYTFHLRPHLRFSDGTALTADDVAYSIDRALSPAINNASGALSAVYLGLLKDAQNRVSGQVPTLIGDSIAVIDTVTLTLTLSKAAPYFLTALTYPSSYVVEKSVIDQWGQDWTNHLGDNNGQGGDGPFKVQRYSQTTGIQLVPNPNYYGSQPQLQRVNFVFFTNEDTAYKAYEAEQVDNALIPLAFEAQAEARVKEFHKYNQLSIDYLGMNYLFKPFDNVHIRQAFELAINKNVLAQTIYHNTNMPTCHLVPQGITGYNSNLTCPGGASTVGDPAQAKTLFTQGLQEEGLTAATFPQITFTFASDSPLAQNEADTLVQMWQTVLGVTVTAQGVTFAKLVTDVSTTPCSSQDLNQCVNKGLQMWSLGWLMDFPDPYDVLTYQFGQGAPNNAENYGQNLCTCASAQQQVQHSLVQADGDSGSDRVSLYQQAEQSLVNDVVRVPMFQHVVSYLVQPYVVGFAYASWDQIAPDDWGHIYIAVH